MSVANAIPEVWAARLLRALESTPRWAFTVMDRSEELASFGDTLHLNQITAYPTIRDYNPAADLMAPELPATADETVEPDQQKYFNIGIEDVDRVQARPALLDEFVRMAAQRIGQVVDDYIRGRFQAAAKINMNIDAKNGAISAIDGADLVDHFTQVGQAMDEAEIPAMGRYAIVSPQIRRQMADWFLIQAVPVGGVVERAVVEGNLVRLGGFDLVIDPRITKVGAGAHQMHFGVPGAGVYIGQIGQVEAYRPESRFMDAVKGLYVYGGKFVYDDRIISTKFTNVA